MADPPHVLHLVDVVPERVTLLRESMAAWRPEVEVAALTAEAATKTLAGLPAGSLIVNATGMGKDRPGSPIPLPGPWPRGAVVWDLNYRGDLPLLADARAAARDRDLQVHDGWRLFVHGWAEALDAILGQALVRARFDAFERAARAVRT
jgi:shikimate 5-dehydrogenase